MDNRIYLVKIIDGDDVEFIELIPQIEVKKGKTEKDIFKDIFYQLGAKNNIGELYQL